MNKIEFYEAVVHMRQCQKAFQAKQTNQTIQAVLDAQKAIDDEIERVNRITVQQAKKIAPSLVWDKLV